MAEHVVTGTYLDRILENTAAEVAERMRAIPAQELQRVVETMDAPLPLADAVTATSDVAVIAEIKRASPSKGEIAAGISAAEVAREYLAGGCAAISVLTDETFFGGSLLDLRDVAEAAHHQRPARPVLRKDFVISPYQILEARAHGADAILLIVAALEDQQLRDLYGSARQFDLDVLVEVHDKAELERALGLEPQIIGINNRDLRTFDVDLATTERLAATIPDGIVIVGESGVHTHADVERLGAAGVDAVLVGESLMRQPDREAAVRELTGR